MDILLYRGCTTPVRLPAYEAATIAVLDKLGVKVHEMNDDNCCGAQYIESVDRMAYAAMSGRILALAEKEGMDILALCGACSGSLKINKHFLDHSSSPVLLVNTNSTNLDHEAASRRGHI